MSTKPNYELLKDAYAIIGGIPEDKFDLWTIIRARGPSLECGTVACAMGWLSLHPGFAERLKPVFSSNERGVEWMVNGVKTFDYQAAAASVFGITERQAKNLFGMRGNSDYDARTPPEASDKLAWLRRVEYFLEVRSQWHGLQESEPC